MPSTNGHRPPRRSPKLNKLLPLSPKRRKPELAVDTNLTQDGRRLPQQIYPPPKGSNDKFISLNDITRLSKEGDTAYSDVQTPNIECLRTGPIRSVKNSYQQKRISTKAVPENGPLPPYKANDTIRDAWGQNKVPFVLQDPPKPRRQNAFNRLVPQKLRTSDVSPSDAKIEIGMAISPGAVQYHKASIGSETSSSQAYPPSGRQPSDKSSSNLRPPTIVVTPVNEDFEARFNGLSTTSEREDRFRPRSSVYSRYTNGMSKVYRSDRTPPVPPLPDFAIGNTKPPLRIDTGKQSMDRSHPGPSDFSGARSVSMSTAFSDDQNGEFDSATTSRSDRFSSHSRIWNARSSQGWWNLVMSPFTPKSASRAFQPSRSPKTTNEQPMRKDKLVKPSKTSLFNERTIKNDIRSDNEPQSAPATQHSTLATSSRQQRVRKRRDTAPGALDIGNIDAVNIYRTPSHGAASSYYDRSKNDPSFVGPAVGTRLDRSLDDGWSPSQSVFRASRGEVSPRSETQDKGSADMRIPTTGEAAPYYDRDRDFTDDNERGHVDTSGGGYATSRAAHPMSSGYRLSGPGSFPVVESPVSAVTPIENRGLAGYPERSVAGSYHAASSPHSSQSSFVLDDGLYERRLSDDSQFPLREDHDRSANVSNTRLDRGNNQVSTFSQQQDQRAIVEMPQHGLDNGQQSDRSADFEGASNAKRPTFSERTYQEEAPRGPPYSEKFEDRDAESDYTQRSPWYRRWLGLFILSGALLLVSLIVLLVLFVPEHHTSTATQVQAQWLNLTGFPPLPTGVATVIGAKSVKEVKGCVKNEALWSCAVPPAESLSTTQMDRPNFRFLIRFRNGTVASNETLLEPGNATFVQRDSDRAANAGAVVRRSAWSNFLFTSDPPPPSAEDQEFLGRTTEHNAQPYNGEETPFYISLLDPVALQPQKRSSLQKRGFHYPYPSASASMTAATASTPSGSSATASSAPQATTRGVPPPALQTNGDLAPAKLYPFAYAQPLSLFNRGRQDEYYGFYTYFDRSIYPSSLPNSTSADGALTNGAGSSNVRSQNAQSICTFSQSRLLVQIWTQKPDVTALPPASNASIPIVKSTANDMKTPGSFPYTITITLDRHGGDESQKGVFCYDIDADHHVVGNSGMWVKEDRSFGGTIKRPGEIPTNNGVVMRSGDAGDEGSIDGGSGGCECQWQS